jgi:hypothetical protein
METNRFLYFIYGQNLPFEAIISSFSRFHIVLGSAKAASASSRVIDSIVFPVGIDAYFLSGSS